MERGADCTVCLLQDEERRMAAVQARREDEKKKETHKQAVHKVADPLTRRLQLVHGFNRRGPHQFCSSLYVFLC